MRFIGVTQTGLVNALGAVNLMYGDNIIFNRCDFIKTRRDGREEWQVTLRVRSSQGPGHGRSAKLRGWADDQQWGGRRMTTACWHVHGCFLDALAAVSRRDAEVELGLRSRRRCLIADHGWKDAWVGNAYGGQRTSEMCDCGGGER
jgi:hypothetical protein